MTQGRGAVGCQPTALGEEQVAVGATGERQVTEVGLRQTSGGVGNAVARTRIGGVGALDAQMCNAAMQQNSHWTCGAETDQTGIRRAQVAMGVLRHCHLSSTTEKRMQHRRSIDTAAHKHREAYVHAGQPAHSPQTQAYTRHCARNYRSIFCTIL